MTDTDPISTLPPALDAKCFEHDGRAGRMRYYVAGDGPPLLLVHSINAAASSYEVKPVFDRLRAERRVYAPDLPGFGGSDRSQRRYDVACFVDAIRDMLDVIEHQSGQERVSALGLSLSAEFVARAAVDAAARFRSLALVTPTGFNRGAERLTGPPNATREMPLLGAVLGFRPWRRGLFRLLTSPGSIRYFLRRTWGSRDIDEELAAYCDLTSARPGAEYAPLAFLSGSLFSRDIRDVYESLRLPVWVAHGTRGDFRDFSGAGALRERDNWRFDAFDTGAMVYFERPDEFIGAYRAFLADAEG